MHCFKKNFVAAFFAFALLMQSFPAFSEETAPENNSTTAVDVSLFSDEQKKEIQVIVKDYLMKNPQVLMEILQALEVEQQKIQQAERQKNYEKALAILQDSKGNLIVGNPEGNVTVVEFFDYNCGYCRRAVKDIQSLVQHDANVKVILRDFPILGAASVEASRVALAVKQQLDDKKMFEFHLKLMEIQGKIDAVTVKDVAKSMKIDMARLEADMNKPEIQQILKEATSIGDALSLEGTPAFLVGGEVIPGAVGLEPLKSIVSNIRTCGKATCAK